MDSLIAPALAVARPAHSSTALAVEELPVETRINLRGQEEDPVFGTAMKRVLGTTPPCIANRFETAGARRIIWLGPDEWLILAAVNEARTLLCDLRAASTGLARSAVTDVSGGSVTLRLAGDGARDLLSAGCAIDLHPRSFEPGDAVQTLLANAPVILLQNDANPTYDLIVRRSLARYLWDWLTSAARDHI